MQGTASASSASVPASLRCVRACLGLRKPAFMRMNFVDFKDLNLESDLNRNLTPSLMPKSNRVLPSSNTMKTTPLRRLREVARLQQTGTLSQKHG